jgi:hypothetical protein
MTPDPASENEIERSLKADKLATQMKRAQLSSRFFKSQVMRTLLESLLLDGALGLTTCANAITRARILVEHNQLAEELSPFWLTVLLVTLSQTNGSFSAGELAPIATQRHSEHLVKSVLSVLPASVIANSDQSKLDCFTGAAGDERVRTLRAAIEHWLDYTLMAFSVLREHIEPTQLQTTIVP